jgi:glucokinase
MIIGVDIGGTSIRAGLIRNGKVVKKSKKVSCIDVGKECFIGHLLECIEEVYVKGVKGIGLGCPGPANYNTGRLINPPNLKPLWGVNLKKIVKKKFRVKVEMDNDANCAALAEIKKRKEKNFVVLTLGTGIGCGIVIDKKLYRGRGKASELGFMIIDNSKSLQDLASGTAITNRAQKKLGKKLLASELVKMRNVKAKKIIKESAEYLGIGLANIGNIFDPDVIVLTGGIKEAGNYYLNMAKKKMGEVCLLKSKVVWSQVKDAGIIGAGCLVE